MNFQATHHPPPPPSGGGSGPDCDNCDYELQDEIMNLDICNYSGGGLIDAVFGTSISCIDEFEHNNDKRIKTKLSAENFWVYASVSQKVKIQKKRNIVFISYWDKSGIAADILETGFETMEFEYDWSFPQSATSFIPDNKVVVHGNLKVIRNSSGQVVQFQGSTQRKLFDDFPFDGDEEFIEIYLPARLQDVINQSTYSLTGEDFNKEIESLTEDALKMLLEYAGMQFDEQDVTFAIPTADFQNDRFIFTYRDFSIRECEDNKVNKIWGAETAQVGFSTDFTSNGTPIFSPANDFDIIEFVGYGIGKEDGCNFAGSKIHLLED